MRAQARRLRDEQPERRVASARMEKDGPPTRKVASARPGQLPARGGADVGSQSAAHLSVQTVFATRGHAQPLTTSQSASSLRAPDAWPEKQSQGGTAEKSTRSPKQLEPLDRQTSSRNMSKDMLKLRMQFGLNSPAQDPENVRSKLALLRQGATKNRKTRLAALLQAENERRALLADQLEEQGRHLDDLIKAKEELVEETHDLKHRLQTTENRARRFAGIIRASKKKKGANLSATAQASLLTSLLSSRGVFVPFTKTSEVEGGESQLNLLGVPPAVRRQIVRALLELDRSESGSGSHEFVNDRVVRPRTAELPSPRDRPNSRPRSRSGKTGRVSKESDLSAQHVGGQGGAIQSSSLGRSPTQKLEEAMAVQGQLQAELEQADYERAQLRDDIRALHAKMEGCLHLPISTSQTGSEGEQSSVDIGSLETVHVEALRRALKRHDDAQQAEHEAMGFTGGSASTANGSDREILTHDIWESVSRLIVVVDLPGVEQADVEVSVGYKQLSIKWSRGGYERKEFSSFNLIHSARTQAHELEEKSVHDFTMELPCPVETRSQSLQFSNGSLHIMLNKLDLGNIDSGDLDLGEMGLSDSDSLSGDLSSGSDSTGLSSSSSDEDSVF